MILATTTSYIFALVCAFCLTYYLIPRLIKIAEKNQLFDLPDHRKMHTQPTPALGGIAIFAGFGIAGLLFVQFVELSSFTSLLIMCFLLLLAGVYDDLYAMKASSKALIQWAVASALFFGGFSINHFTGIFGGIDLPIGVSYILTTLFLMTVINAYNLIDGVDGLAGSLGLVAAIIFGGAFYLIGMTGWSMMAFALAVSILAFLRFNFFNARIFMGDSGSMLIGLLIGVFSIVYLGAEGSAGAYSFGHLPLVFAIVLLPVFDLFRVFFCRIIKGNSPFKADRTHIHHLLQSFGMKPPMICTSLIILSLSITFCAIGLSNLPHLLSLGVLSILMGEGFLILLLVKDFQKRVRTKRKFQRKYSMKNTTNPTFS